MAGFAAIAYQILPLIKFNLPLIAFKAMVDGRPNRVKAR
jgi:hypothetical protein